MTLTDTMVAKPPPIHVDESGTLRVGGTRVTLDTVVGEFLDGSTAEEIAVNFPTVRLPDIYATISYYLDHRTAVDEYVARRAAEADALQSKIERHVPPEGLRARLLARLGPQRLA